MPEAPATPQAPAAPAPNPAPVNPAVPAPGAPTGNPAPPAEPKAEPKVERVVPAADAFKLPEGMPKELGVFANKHGFTQEQLDATLAHFNGAIESGRQAEMAALESTGAQFIQSWGEQAKGNLNLAKQALKEHDPQGVLTKALKESGYVNHPGVLGFLVSVGKLMSEGGFIKSSANAPAGDKTLAQTLYGKSEE